MADIRETGPVGLKGLKGLNQQKDVSEMSLEEQWNSINSIPRSAYSAAPEESVGISAMQAGYGDSQYDEGITSESQFSDIGDIRYANQPWYDTLANGIGKMLGTAGTTFVSSLVGLPYGLYQAANQGRWSALWDNDVTQGLAKADEWLENNLTNYRSQIQQNSPWYDPENLFSMNFIADDVIKNMGFTLGAAASMAVGSGSLGLMSRALGFVNDVGKGAKMGSAALSALFSATGEGMIEARQGVEERNKLEMQKLDDSLAVDYNAIEMQREEINNRYALTGDYQTYRQQMSDLNIQKQMLDERKAAGQQQIIESGQKMGNTILLANQGLLTLGNLIQFGKGMVKSFDSARHAAEISSKTAKPFGVGIKTIEDNAKNGYKLTGKNFGKAIAATKGIFTEGSEEMNQQFIQSASGAAFNEGEVNDYWKARLDPESYRDTTKGLYTMGQILDRGFNESWGDADQWEQFVIGGLTGMAGSYSPTKLFNQDTSKSRFNPSRYGSWEGGAYNAIRDYNKEYNQLEENVNDLNKILQSEEFPARVQSMVGHTYTESAKENAADTDNKKAWKDADEKQFVHDIQAFLRVGKLDDLRAIYNELGSQLSDEDIENIVKSTTKEISAEEDKQNSDKWHDEEIAKHQRKITELNQKAQTIADSQDSLDINERADYQVDVTPELEKIFSEIDRENDIISGIQHMKEVYVPKKYYEGAYVDREGNRTATDEEIRETVKHNAEELNRKLDSYLDSIQRVNEDTGGNLSKDQEDNLAYLHHLGRESLVRADKIISDKRKQMPSKFLMKTDKTPEQLTKEYVSSDLVFSKDENTREGYVEVDTSLMDDRSFRNFFIGELLWGGNIDPEFGETAEEKAAREAEENALSEEEKKKKARERLTKKWKDALEKRQKDAEEQRDVNGNLIAEHFITSYKKNTNASNSDIQNALNSFFQDIVDASSLISQSGEYDKTLREYMQNPSKVDEDKAKEEVKAQKAEAEKQTSNKFEGKNSKQMKQEIADGTVDMDDFNDFADMDLSGDAPAPLRTAQEEARKAKESMQKANSLKQHIQDQLPENPTQEELNAAQTAMQMVDDAMLATDDPSELNIDMPELNQVPLDALDYNADIDDVENLNNQVQGMLTEAFNSLNEDESAQNDIPETVPSDALNDVEPPTTGHDETTKIIPETVVPKVQSKSEASNNPILKDPLTEGAIANIIKASSDLSKQTASNGTWRSTTTRNPYHKSTGTYHDDVLTDKNSVQYKRSKAIWEYLNKEGAFDRQANASADRIKLKDTIHFMVKYLPEVFGARLEEVSDKDKPYAMAIIMLNDNGEVVGDLPLAELEPSFNTVEPTKQVKDLKAFQDKMFNAFLNHYRTKGGYEAIVDGILHKDNIDNLNLTFDNVKKSPLVSKVKQVMRGVVPFRFGEINTLNEVIQGIPEIAIKVTGTTVALKRGDKTQHKDVVIPSVGNTGQPYLLLPTASGEKMAVPFYMPAFNAEQHRNTELYKQLSNAIFYLLQNNSQTTNIQKEAFLKHLDALKGMLQVTEQKGVKIVDVKKDSIILHLQSLTDPNRLYDISVPSSFGDAAQIATALADKMSGIPINVSLQYANDVIETGVEKGEIRKSNYNQMIGEIANVNLPKATTHTVNSWFTVELTTQIGTKPSKAVTTKSTGSITENIGGRTIEIDVDNLTAVDTSTGEIIENDEEVALKLAQIKASKPLYKDKDYIQVSINGELRTYDVKNNKFIKNPSKPASNRRDFVKEIVSAKTIKELIDIQNAATQAQADGNISSEDLIKLSGYMNQKRADIYAETPDVTDVISNVSGAVAFEESPKPKENKPKAKTIEEIETEVKNKKIVGRQNKDAWTTIPDNLKLKMVNEGQPLQLSFNGKVMVVSLSDREGLIKSLNDANMAAKAGNLKVSEAIKPMEKEGITITRENEQAARRWLAKNLPSLSSEERTQFVEKLSRMGENASKYWGSYRSGVIQIQKNAPMGTVYHEAFHYVLDMVLSPEERAEIIAIAKDEYGINDSWIVEERLANDFRRYALDENAKSIVGRIKRWLRKIKDKISRYNRISDATINQLFWKINNGELTDKAEYVENFESTQQNVLAEIRNVQKENMQWNNLSASTKSALKESISESTYNSMSLEEKEQYAKCLG